MTGLDENVCSNYSFVDSFFDNELGVEHMCNKKTNRRAGITPDPLLGSRQDANIPRYRRDVYFLVALDNCLSHVCHEWTRICELLENEAKR